MKFAEPLNQIGWSGWQC